MPRILIWILVSTVVGAGLAAALWTPADPATMAKVVFPLFLVALIAVGLRAFLRRPHV